MNSYSIAVLLFAFGVMVMGLIASFKRTDHAGRAFCYFSIAVSCWGILFSIFTNYDMEDSWALRTARYSEAFAVFIPITWCHFVFSLLGKREPVKGFFRANCYFTVSLALASLFTGFISGIRPMGCFHYYKTPGPGFHVFPAYFLLIISYSMQQIYTAYQKAEGVKRYQLCLLFWAMLFPFAGGAATFLPLYGIDAAANLIFLLPLYPFLLAVPLLKYGLLDEESLAEAAHRDKLAAIGTLAASINHEIKNPLYVMQGLGQSFLANVKEGLVEESELKSSAFGLVERLTAQSTRAIEIMRKFAVFAKQEAREAPGTASISLKSALDNVLPLVRHEFELNKIKIEESIPSDLPEIRFDSHHLEQVLFNLLLNSSQALKSQGGRGIIRLSATCEQEGVRFCVEDNGPGIPAEDLKKIFEPFYTTKSEGTGLGLYITRQLVERNGGKISVQSNQGAGAEFQLSFVRG